MQKHPKGEKPQALAAEIRRPCYHHRIANAPSSRSSKIRREEGELAARSVGYAPNAVMLAFQHPSLATSSAEILENLRPLVSGGHLDCQALNAKSLMGVLHL